MLLFFSASVHNQSRPRRWTLTPVKICSCTLTCRDDKNPLLEWPDPFGSTPCCAVTYNSTDHIRPLHSGISVPPFRPQNGHGRVASISLPFKPLAYLAAQLSALHMMMSR